MKGITIWQNVFWNCLQGIEKWFCCVIIMGTLLEKSQRCWGCRCRPQLNWINGPKADWKKCVKRRESCDKRGNDKKCSSWSRSGNQGFSSCSSRMWTSDYAETRSIQIGNICADFYQANEESSSNMLVWTSEEDDLAFCIMANLPDDTMIKLVEGVQKK